MLNEEIIKERLKNITIENLTSFLNELMDSNVNYSTVCKALGIGAVACATAMDKHKNGGITGFQAGAVMWEFIKNWNYKENKTSMRIVDYDNMLFPQYEYRFEKTITSNTFESLKREAKRLLDEKDDFTSERVIEHWKSIVEGKVPFGYTISDEI